MANGGHRVFTAILVTAALPTVFLACKREDPQIRTLTEKAAQTDDAAQQLRQAWSEQLERLTLAGVRDPRFGVNPMLLTPEQKKALEARVRLEKDNSRRGLLREILDKDVEIQGLIGKLASLKAALPPPEIVKPNDSHYGLALRFLLGRGCSEAQARKILSRVVLAERLAPGFEVYHFFEHGDYATWVSQGRASSPRDLDTQDPEALAEDRDEAVAVGRRLQRELGLLMQQKRLIEEDIAAIQAERKLFLEGRDRLQTENARLVARMNSLHYLVGLAATLEKEGIIEIPLIGKNLSGRNWRDTLFTRHLDLRSGTTILIRAQDLGLKQIRKVSVVPGSHTPGKHYRLTLSADRQTATVELLDLPRFRNEKVAFAIVD